MASSAAHNIAPQTPYTLSPAPNADYARSHTGRELTDGRRASGRFWLQNTTVGWEWKSPVVYRQSFQTTTGITAIEIGTGANTYINLPSQAFVYARNSHGRFRYIGDAAREGRLYHTGLFGQALLRFEFPPVRTNEIRIVFYRDGQFLFLDEVRILAEEGGTDPDGALNEADILPDARHRRLDAAYARADGTPLGTDPAARYAWPLPSAAGTTTRDCQITRISPWDAETAEDLETAKPFGITELVQATGGVVVAAFRVENQTDIAQRVMLSSHAPVGLGELKPSTADYTLALDYRWRADVVVPANMIILPPHSMTLVLAQAQTSHSGPFTAELAVACGDAHDTFRITGHTIAVADGDIPHGNLWSYLVPPTAAALVCQPDLHQEYWVDTAVVPPEALDLHRPEAAARMFRAYLAVFRKSRRLLLFLDMTDPYWAGLDQAVMRPPLQAWWRWADAIIKASQYQGEVAFYPLDEPKPDQIPYLNSVIDIFHAIAPTTPVFGTVDNLPALQGAHLDLVQAREHFISSLAYNAGQRREYQVYDVHGSAKTLGLTNHYRKLPWAAFAASLSGTGIWSMWDSSGAANPSEGWADFGGNERDFALLYGGKDGCGYPSRRLLAWRRGQEDMAILQSCQWQTGQDLRSRVSAAIQGNEARISDLDAELASLTERCIND
jgi:hypothetical protein